MRNSATTELKDACAWRPTVYERKTDISPGKCCKVLQALDKTDGDPMSAHSPRMHVRRLFNTRTICRVMAKIKNIDKGYQGP